VYRAARQTRGATQRGLDSPPCTPRYARAGGRRSCPEPALLEQQLRAWEMQVDCVADGPTALAQLQAAHRNGTPYALAILDVQMPGMDGLELARTITADPLLRSLRLVLLRAIASARKTARCRMRAVLSP